MGAAVQEGGALGVLERLRAEGKLTEADVFEVEGVVDLLAERWCRGEISTHFAEFVLRKLADDKTRDWLARTGRTGVWDK